MDRAAEKLGLDPSGQIEAVGCADESVPGRQRWWQPRRVLVAEHDLRRPDPRPAAEHGGIPSWVRGTWMLEVLRPCSPGCLEPSASHRKLVVREPGQAGSRGRSRPCWRILSKIGQRLLTADESQSCRGQDRIHGEHHHRVGGVDSEVTGVNGLTMVVMQMPNGSVEFVFCANTASAAVQYNSFFFLFSSFTCGSQGLLGAGGPSLHTRPDDGRRKQQSEAEAGATILHPFPHTLCDFHRIHPFLVSFH
jgi:hypothetical protein